MEAKTFPGGAYIPHYKFTDDKPIEDMSIPEEIVIPLAQHIGSPCEPLVKVGDRVEVGQKIGDSEEYITAPVHASVSGEVVAIEERPFFEGDEVESIVIKPDSEQQEFSYDEKNIEDMSLDDMKDRIREAGVVGMGGAAFPTYVNINQSKPIDSLLINGAECEPFLTCDHRQMVERSEELVIGAEILMNIIGAKKCYFGIEENKPDAIDAVSKQIEGKDGMEVVPLKTKYPQGYKVNVIHACTGRDVPRGVRSADLGCIVRNVGTTIATYEAVKYGKPLMERVVTVSGYNIPEAGNYNIKIGTPVEHVLRECGVDNFENQKVILGGPMTGTAVKDIRSSVVKNSTGLLLFPEDMTWDYTDYNECVRCGKCVERCPVHLYPNKIGMYAEHKQYSKAEEWDIMDCGECGTCVYFCPANRPILMWIQQVKPTVKRRQRQRSK
ncbi:electron transport complex subunit RsxC [Natranaerobius thermophilus]|uniref:Ion-translocating oxidoreductase complex subunit C n=1 Tax=Natranaerobius thermophilus (strain ATCC BAA-1301 / DSM 18059 / JW/NM-WN-LF) TaxID=457570 RepID=B2A6C4_NATTJ|nr:electron transport complex subunit RsxC [Natranaerobius thermophilus]ACB84135.1 electron transport complex, RnfABCDGE type, C subunit [Natranaerobius thermophilus JW/NM-WN-LF]